MASAHGSRSKAGAAAPDEVRLYSHSPIIYWWPVWLLGFAMALLTYLEGGLMAVVPPGAVARRDWRVEVAPGRIEAREGLILPPSAGGRTTHLPPGMWAEPGEAVPPPEQPHVLMSHNQYLGTLFLLAGLLVYITTGVPLRGLWQWIAVLVIALAVTLVLWLGLWGRAVDLVRMLHVQINLAGYLIIATVLFAIWAVAVFWFDTLTYIIVSEGQVRIRQEIGEGEKVYDVTNLTFQVQPNVLFRHRVLGLVFAGDLAVRTGGPHPEVFDWPNVFWVRRRLKRIERYLSREVQATPERDGRSQHKMPEASLS